MARLIGVIVLLWAVYASVGFSLEHAPRPEPATPVGASDPLDGPSPVEAISEATARREAIIVERRPGRSWSFGVHRVGDSPDPDVARRDSDVEPRGETAFPFGEWIGAVDVPGYSQSVPGEIPPGLYATSIATEGCSYQLHRVMEDGRIRVIAEESLSSGRLLVTINEIEPDWFTSSAACGRWSPWRPFDEPRVSAGDGDYGPGDLATGTWTVPEPCRWETVVGFRGGFLLDVVDNGSGPGAMRIDEDTLGVRIRGCRAPMRLSSRDADSL